ncbi:MAG: hypothetical protein NTV86_22530 [Planctomycetota bacterium]|nr:hypothetical protein [Planctomycetota bacterium]
MNYRTMSRVALACLLGAPVLAASARAATPGEDENPPKVYVPYRDLAAVIDDGAKAVLMDRTEFAKLLDQARGNARAADSQRLAQITDAQYQAVVTGQNLALTGRLKVVSLSDSPVAVPMAFGRLGLLEVKLDGKGAPLGYDGGVLVLLVTGKGEHEVTVSASAVLAEVPLAKFPAGGLQLGIAIPPAVAGTMTLSAPGDLDISTTAAAAKGRYDRATDRTTVDLTIGGRDAVTAVLLGNGRQEAARPILVGESTTSVELGRNDQTLYCLFTVDVLGRSVRELEFVLDKSWTVTSVSCPDLVRWSAASPGEGGQQTLTVRLRSACRGLLAIQIKATSVVPAREEWRSPRISLAEAAFQRGYLLVNAGKELRVRGQELVDARREDVRSARMPEAFGLLAGRLYYHWGDQWSVKLRTAGVALRRESQDRQSLTVSEKNLTLRGQFQVTAVGAEMFDLSLALPPAAERWELVGVTVNGRADGFEYHLADSPAAGSTPAGRTLQIELARPVAPEAVADVSVTLQHVPAGWAWPAGAPPREIAVPMLRCLADAVSGVVSVTTAGDLDAAAVSVAQVLKPVTVGRMTSMGLTGQVQLAYTYDRDGAGSATLSISRRKARLAADSVGLVSLRPEGLTASWTIRYNVSRARTAQLSLLADVSLGEQITIRVPGRQIASRQRVPAEGSPADKGPRYDLWKIALDSEADGVVPVEVEYTRPMPAGAFALPLVRPAGAEQVSEVLAVQAGEELAVEASAADARWVDSADLSLPPGANRVLAAWRFEGGGAPVVTLTTTVHKPMAIPPALAASATLTTYLEAQGDQRTEARFDLVNAGLQFLSIHLDERASLWSISVDGNQAKPQRDTRGDYMVPLPRGDRKCTVKVVYAAKSPSTDPITLAAATLPGVKVNLVTWHVLTPGGHYVTGQNTHMMSDEPKPQTPAYQQLAEVLSESAARPKAAATGLKQQLPARATGVQFETESDVPADAIQESAVDRTRTIHGWSENRPATRPAAAVNKSERADKTPPGLDTTVGLATGRYTLPVELVAGGWRGRETTFTALDQGNLTVSLSDERSLDRRALLGFTVAGIVGLLCIRRKARAKARGVLALLVATSLAATWWPATTAIMNGMFYAGLTLTGLYLTGGLARWIAAQARRVNKLAPTVGAAMLVVAMSWSPARAQAPVQAPPAPPTPAPAALVVPYEGDPTKADQAAKVLVPYARYLELWNRAHPEQANEPPPAGGRVWLADVRYAAAVEGDKFHLTLSAQVQVLGKGLAVVPMPLERLAVVAASLNETPVVVPAGADGIDGRHHAQDRRRSAHRRHDLAPASGGRDDRDLARRRSAARGPRGRGHPHQPQNPRRRRVDRPAGNRPAAVAAVVAQGPGRDAGPHAVGAGRPRRRLPALGARRRNAPDLHLQRHRLRSVPPAPAGRAETHGRERREPARLRRNGHGPGAGPPPRRRAGAPAPLGRQDLRSDRPLGR